VCQQSASCDGQELADRFKAARPEVVVFCTSGYTDDVIAHRGVLDRDMAFIPRSYPAEELAAKVREGLTGGSKERSFGMPAGRQHEFYGLIAKRSLWPFCTAIEVYGRRIVVVARGAGSECCNLS
jgi:hypothetical protein